MSMIVLLEARHQGNTLHMEMVHHYVDKLFCHRNKTRGTSARGPLSLAEHFSGLGLGVRNRTHLSH